MEAIRMVLHVGIPIFENMQLNILWSGREYYSLENCITSTTSRGSRIVSVIIGKYAEAIYKIEYLIETNSNWQTTSVELKAWSENKFREINFKSDGMGTWTTHGKAVSDLNGCIDIDISLTPFTNTLPINRLQLQQNDSQEIKVIYFDILNDVIRSATQRYTRLSKAKYRFENVPNDFEAELEVDEYGFVIDYPELFVRSALVKSNYP